uniref:(northern house mosquito) hypothetical protein n=1 Tax=Culex pipiens TaxID=7175 RepID=A0A8D8PIW4_CULPI
MSSSSWSVPADTIGAFRGPKSAPPPVKNPAAPPTDVVVGFILVVALAAAAEVAISCEPTTAISPLTPRSKKKCYSKFHTRSALSSLKTVSKFLPHAPGHRKYTPK